MAENQPLELEQFELEPPGSFNAARTLLTPPNVFEMDPFCPHLPTIFHKLQILPLTLVFPLSFHMY